MDDIRSMLFLWLIMLDIHWNVIKKDLEEQNGRIIGRKIKS